MNIDVKSKAGLILLLISQNSKQGLRITDIAKALNMWHSNVAKILNQLQKDGTIIKTKVGRITRIGLTDKGEELVKSLLKNDKKVI